MPVAWAPLALVGPLLTLAAGVMSLAGNAQRYRRKCKLLEDRVRGIANHLKDLQIKRCTPDPPAMQDTLERLREVLIRAQVLAQSCQRKKKAFDFLRARKKTGEFAFLNEQISSSMETFHVANRTLIMGLYSDQVFMVVLRMLLGDDACRGVLRRNREVVERCLSLNEFSGTGSTMSPEKIEMLELIRACLTLGPGRRGDAARAANYEEEIRHIDSIARDIVLKADAPASHNREEVQRVAQLARHVLYFLPNLRFPQLTRHRDTRGLVTKLQLELEAANHTIESRPPIQCVRPAAMVAISATTSFWREQARRLGGHANSIELGLQSLTFIALNQLMNKA